MKRRITFLIIACIPLLALGIFNNNIFTEIKQYNVEMQLKNDEALVSKLEARILERFSKAEQDLIFIATYLGQNLSKDETLSSSDSQTLKRVMDNVLPSFLNVNHAYQEISFLDKNGEEIIVAANNQVQISTPVNKANEDYFRGSTRHQAGEVYVSFDGNSVRIASPIYDDGRFFGTVVLTLHKDILLRELQEETKNKVMLIEDTGKYILTSNPQSGPNFAVDFSPEVLDTIKNSSKTAATATGHTESGQGTLLTFVPLRLDDHKWFLITQADKGTVTANTSVLQRQLMVIIIVAFIIILGLLGLWSLSYGKALKSEQLRRENDELADLNSLLRRKQTELEEQTAVVEELNAQLEDESRRYQQQKDTLQAIIDSIEKGLAMTDTTGKTIFMNKVWRRIFRYDQGNGDDSRAFTESDIGTDPLIQKVVAGAANAEQISDEIKKLRSNFTEHYRAELEYKESTHRYCRISSVPCRATDGQALGRIFLFRDITRYKEVDLLKSELISTVSHELRTPMSSIMGFAELLLTRQLTPERSRQYIEVIHEQSGRLTRLISDFLDIQRMESGKQAFDKQRLDFIEIVNQALELFSNTEEKHRIVFESSRGESLYIHGERDKLVQVMSNLLSNAIKYSPQGGKIKVKVTVQEGMLQTSVSDHGLGIPEDARAKLFSKFFRVDNDDRRKIGGTGLGLAICKEIIQAHYGEIWVESIYGEGSTFFFTLPLVVNKGLSVRTIP